MNKLIVALVGKAGSGKDALAKALAKYPGINNIISCTTRPIREGEQDGVAYHFLTVDEFAQKVINGDMLEATCFNGWHYGTMKSSLKEGINVGVFNPEGYDCLAEMPIPGVKVLGYLLECEDKTRMLRQLNREEDPDVHEIVRRFSTDEDDFMDISEDLVVLWNEDWDDWERNREKIIQDIDDAGFAAYHG